MSAAPTSSSPGQVGPRLWSRSTARSTRDAVWSTTIETRFWQRLATTSCASPPARCGREAAWASTRSRAAGRAAPATGGRTYQRLAWAPAQVHRAVLALLDGLSVGFLKGERWVVSVDDPLDAVLELLPPYLDMIAAIDRLWGGTVAPREVVLIAGDRRRRFVLGKQGYEEQSCSEGIDALRPDLTIRLESDRGPIDRLRRSSDGPEIVVRSSFLPVDVLDPVYEGSGTNRRPQ